MIGHIVKTNKSLPFKHKFGKLAVGTVAGFLATELAEKVYEMVLEAHWRKKLSK